MDYYVKENNHIVALISIVKSDSRDRHKHVYTKVIKRLNILFIQTKIW